MDPVLIELITTGVSRLGPYAVTWAKGPVHERMAAALAGRMEENEFQLLSFDSLAKDEEYEALIEDAFKNLQLDDSRARSVLRQHVDDIRGEAETEALVGQIAALLRFLLPMFAPGGSAALALQTGLQHQEAAQGFRALEEQLSEIHAAVRATAATPPEPLVIEREWLAGRSADAWVRLIETDAQEGARLRAELGVEPSTETVRAFLERTETAVPAVWETVMSIASEAGNAELAQEAAIRYARSEGADRARGLAWAASLADQLEDHGARDTLIAEAQALDPEHPSLLLLRARLITDPHERLELLKRISPIDARQEAALEGHLALTYFQAGDLDAAYAAVERAKAADPEELLTMEVEASLIILEAQDGRGLAWQRAEKALEDLERVRERLRTTKRFDQSTQIAGRMTQVHQLFGSGPNEIRAIASTLLPEERQRDESAQVAAALLAVGDAPSALELLPEDPDDEFARFVRASALLRADPQRFLEEGVPVLDALLEAEDVDLRVEAAWMRAGAALLDEPAPESSAAVEILAQRDPVRIRLYEAFRASGADPERAEEILAAGGEQAELLVERGRLAASTQDWLRALPLYGRAVRLDPSPINRLAFAHALREAGQLEEARDEALELARRSDYSPYVRDTAYRLAYTITQQKGEVAAQARLVEEWLDTADSPKVAWSLVWSLARLARYSEARSIIERRHLRPDDEANAVLYADVVIHTSPPKEALEELLSTDEAVPNVRSIEARIAMLAHAISPEGIDPELIDRAVAVARAYPERFPDGGIEQVEIDPADPFAAIRPRLEERAAVVAATSEAVAQGQAPIAALAAATGRDIGALMLSLIALPLGSGSEEVDAIELDAARRAVDNPVVWESTAINIAGGLGAALFTKIKAAFQTPTVAQAVIEDARLGAHDALTANPSGTLGIDPSTGQVFYHEYVAGELERETHRAKSILGLLEGLDVVADSDEAHEGDIGRSVREQGYLDNPALATAAATLAVIERTAYPLYSDDPQLRDAARQLGLGAFGTPALLVAMQERGMVDAAEVAEAVGKLLRSGIQGLPVALFDAIAEARAADWRLTPALRAFLLDTRRWNNDLDANLLRWHAFLRIAAAEAPIWLFQRWVFRVVDAMVLSLPDTNSPEVLVAAVAMASVAGELTEDEQEYRRKLLESLNFVRQFYGIEKRVGVLVYEWLARAEAAVDEVEKQAAPDVQDER